MTVILASYGHKSKFYTHSDQQCPFSTGMLPDAMWRRRHALDRPPEARAERQTVDKFDRSLRGAAIAMPIIPLGAKCKLSVA